MLPGKKNGVNNGVCKDCTWDGYENGKGKYVGVDQCGGGWYPWITLNCMQAHVLNDIESAKKYRKQFNACDVWVLKKLFGLVLGDEL